jgi:hypothetical protein
MKLHHQESFPTQLFITTDGRIAIKQKAYPEDQTVFLTANQGLLLYKALPDSIKEAQEQTQAYRKVQDKQELNDE